MDPVQSNLISPLVWKRIAYYRRTTRLAEYLEQHPDETITLEEASTIACMQKSSFSRFFSQHIGMTFSDFLSAYRVELAMRAMLKSNLSIKEIAYAVGFNCIATFERHFKKETGMRPSSYRTRQLANSDLLVTTSHHKVSSVSQS